MVDVAGKHVFVSYVREDSERVDSLCSILEAAQIPYWRDRSALGPGDAWRAKIKQAIREGSLVFLACFSENSRARDISYMNEELTLAVDEFRKMPPGRTWLIPVRFDAGDVPEWDLGAGRSLSDLNYSDLFGPEHMANATRLVTTIHRLTGEKQPDAATALAAVEQATAADRTDLLKRLTKEMLLDPTRRIELDDLVSQEVRRILSALTDADRAGTGHMGTDAPAVAFAHEAQSLWALSAPFCASLQVAGRWGTPDALTPWVAGLRSFVSAAERIEAGVEGLLAMRHLPGMVGIMVAGLASISNGKWANLKTLVGDPMVRDRYGRGTLSILEATDPYAPFGTADLTAQALARAVADGRDVVEVYKDLAEGRSKKYRTPIAEWLLRILRPVFEDQYPDSETYESEFDRAEVLLGILAQDAIDARISSDQSGSGFGQCRWFGRSTWRSSGYSGSAVEDVASELTRQGSQWGPLQAGLFGGDEGRAKAAVAKYTQTFNEVARQHRF